MKFPLLSVAVGRVSDSGAIYVTLSFVTWWVTVILLLVTPVITFQPAEDELVKHPGYEESPVDVQQLKNHQHHVEEVVSKEGRVVVQRVHPGTVDQPEREDDNSGNHKDDSKNHKDGIRSPMKFGIVQHLSTLKQYV